MRNETNKRVTKDEGWNASKRKEIKGILLWNIINGINHFKLRKKSNKTKIEKIVYRV